MLRKTRVGVASAAAFALATVSPCVADSARESLRKTIDRIVDRPALAHASWGIEIRNAGSGETLYERNADKAFRPASTLKLVTTAAALDAFGPDARFGTTVETAGRLDSRGRLLGDVWLVGGGDPSLSARFTGGDSTAPLEAMADALAAVGVRRIEGRVMADERAFVGERRGADWTWEDLTWGYGAETSALSFNDNVVHLALSPGERPGDPAVLDVVPRTRFVSVVSEVITTDPGSEEDLHLEKPSGTNRVLVSGGLPEGGRWEADVAVEDPAFFAATVFCEVLEARGIGVTGGAARFSEPPVGELRVVTAHQGASLARLIENVNGQSQNLGAEMLLRLLGLRVRGEGSVKKGLEAVGQFLEDLHVPVDGWGLCDGSGLSPGNLLTPRGLASMLVAMDRHPHASVFRASLAVAGVSGTLEWRMRRTAAAGRVVAKTGTLRGVNALAGYVTTTRNERLAFVILVNNHVGLSPVATAAIDDIAVALATAR